MRTTILIIIGLLAALAIGWFYLNALFWILNDRKCEQ